MSDDQPHADAAPLFLFADLLYPTTPTYGPVELAAAVQGRLPRVELISPADQASPVLFAHPDLTTRVQDSPAPVPMLTLVSDVGKPVDPDRLAPLLQHTYAWPAARNVVAQCKGQLLVAEFMARSINYKDRIRAFIGVLAGVAQATHPLAVAIHSADKVIDPQDVYDAWADGTLSGLVRPLVNVRLFNVEGRPGDTLMDSRGLAALGLPDVQLHFRQSLATPGRVAAVLFDAALYLVENGDCVRDGHTIQGLSPDQRWRCRHEAALVGPRRVVLDMDPGAPHAAGTRRRDGS